ncbi:MAG: hypothetical protein HKN07_06530 [Acidimicrobiia bacterium]|nr:hypothetical protein [Acidimicrobiia bacterium]
MYLVMTATDTSQLDLPTVGPTLPPNIDTPDNPRARIEWSVASAAVAIVIWGVLVSPNAVVPSWSYRSAFLPLAIAIGIPAVISAVSGRHRIAAYSGLAFIGLATISTVLSSNPDLSATGRYGVAGGLVFTAALIGAWGIGLGASDRQTTVAKTIGVVVAVNATIGVVQVLTDPSIPAFQLINGRAAALVGNPVHLAALITAGLAMLAFTVQRWTPSWFLAAGALAFSAQSTGTRLTLIVIPLIVLFAALKLGVKRGLVFALIVLAATGAGTVVLDDPTTASSVERLASTAGEANERIETWKAAVGAITAKPLTGWGPGLFLDATAPEQSQELAAATADSTLFVDGHNLAVEYAVTTGLLGVVALGMFIGFSLLKARGPLLAFVLVLLAFHAIQPQSSSTTPLLFLALGASLVDGRERAESKGYLRAVMASVGLLVGGVFLYGDLTFSAATADWQYDDATTAARVFTQWPEPAAQVARVKFFESVAQRTPGAEEEALEWLLTAALADPADPGGWNELGFAEAALGEFDTATGHFLRALESDPWSTQALVSLADLALIEGDVALARTWADKAASVSTSQQVTELVDRVGAASS